MREFGSAISGIISMNSVIGEQKQLVKKVKEEAINSTVELIK